MMVQEKLRRKRNTRIVTSRKAKQLLAVWKALHAKTTFKEQPPQATWEAGKDESVKSVSTSVHL